MCATTIAQSYLKTFAAACLVAASACTTANTRTTPMETTGWTTHCFGRFLIDLPPQAKVRESYEIWGENISAIAMTPESLMAKIDSRERELKLQQHETEGSMLVRKSDFPNGSASIIFWNRSYSNSLMQSETYLVSNNRWAAFLYSGGVAPSKIDSAVSFYESLDRNIRARRSEEIPTEPGFCIDGGYVAGSEYQSESFSVGVTMRDHPGMHLAISASTGAAEDGLLDRLDGFMGNALAGALAGIKTLRKTRRNVGPIQGEEYLIAGSDRGQRSYSFVWESQGKDRSLSEPNIDVALGVLERDPDDDGNPPPPAFESDEQALQLWDAIIESIRLRPGAV